MKTTFLSLSLLVLSTASAFASDVVLTKFKTSSSGSSAKTVLKFKIERGPASDVRARSQIIRTALVERASATGANVSTFRNMLTGVTTVTIRGNHDATGLASFIRTTDVAGKKLAAELHSHE